VLKHEEHKNLILARASEENFIEDVLHDLLKRKIQSVLIEGGTQTINLFLNKGIWDEARVFTSPKIFGDGIPAPYIKQPASQETDVGPDTLRLYQNNSSKIGVPA
jgi:diaminohydroxyphosphoribosylaminopyrimidine deaminase/5-amino-6-(5-phosphoribosylamino)uracil reductase